jgi:dienelactone hydrolase
VPISRCLLSGVALLAFTLAASAPSSLSLAADEPAGWVKSAELPAAEAHQAAAADEQYVYAVTNTKVARYDRATGKKNAESSGEAKHLNSGYLWRGKLYCAHSNYPGKPEQSEIKVLDPQSMRLTTFKDFGDYGGSLTWAVRHDGDWWCNFAHYGEDNAKTFLVRFDDQWRELGRWTYPEAVIKRLGRYSLSGGIWHGDAILATGHDDPVVFRLQVPKQGSVLTLLDERPVPFTGQGIARDPATGGLVGINRAKKLVVFAEPRGDVEGPQSESSLLPRLPRDKLLLYRGPDNKPRPVQNVDDWQRRRREILTGMQQVTGKLPGAERRCPLAMKVEEEVDCGSYVRRRITYASEPGSRVPAYLCVPKKVRGEDGKKAAAVLCLHPTDNNIGYGVVVGLGGRANRQYASELAERGYVTLSPSYPQLADYQPDLKKLGWEAGTLKAVWDNLRGLDLLDSLPYVKHGAYGAIGHSLGGHNAVYTAVFDDRIKVVVSSCGLDSYLDYYGGDERRWLHGQGWAQDRYMPRLAEYRGRLEEIPFDFHELIGALAPRRVLIIAPQHDHNFRADSVDCIAAAAREVFKLYGKPDNLRVEHPDCNHDFPDAMREKAYKLLDEVLR